MSAGRSVRSEIAEMLSEPLESVLARERNTLKSQVDYCGGEVVLFGAGNLGRRAVECLREIGVTPLAFSDNNPAIWGSQVEGINVLSPEVAALRYPKALFLVTIWKPNHWFQQTQRKLRNLGCQCVVPPSALYWRFADRLLPFYLQDRPSELLRQSAEVLDAATLWEDEESALEYMRQVAFRFRGEWNFAPSAEKSYFLDAIFSLMRDEVFIDCGAFDGDTIAEVISRQPDFGQIIAIEPDSLNFRKLADYISELPASQRDRITAHQVLVGSDDGFEPFSASGDMGARASASGDQLVRCVRLGVLLNGARNATFIKMDIEGAEPVALEGARAVIERDHPILAVCVYHEQNHLWKLPLLMRSIAEGYRMYLRCHEGDGWQTVAYAVPGWRVKGAGER